MTKADFTKWLHETLTAPPEVPFVVCIYRDDCDKQLHYNLFDVDLNIKGGGDFSLLLEQLNTLK